MMQKACPLWLSSLALGLLLIRIEQIPRYQKMESDVSVGLAESCRRSDLQLLV
jgi:hypothetical protein